MYGSIFCFFESDLYGSAGVSFRVLPYRGVLPRYLVQMRSLLHKMKDDERRFSGVCEKQQKNRN